jgi:hypothetical protein
VRFSTATPGRVQQLAGQAGYAFDVPVGTTLSTTVTTPTLDCAAVSPAYAGEQVGEQLTLELSNEYVMEQSWCTGGQQYDQVNVYLTDQAYNPAPVPFDSTTVDGTALGAYLASDPGAGGVEASWRVRAQVVLTGNGFTGATAVTFTPQGGTPVDAPTFTVDGDGRITATVPDSRRSSAPGSSRSSPTPRSRSAPPPARSWWPTSTAPRTWR